MNSPAVVLLTPEQLSELVKRAVEEALAEQRQDAIPILLDRAGIAQRLNTSPTTVDRLRRAGMPVVWIGESPRFEVDACVAWIRGQSCREEGHGRG